MVQAEAIPEMPCGLSALEEMSLIASGMR